MKNCANCKHLRTSDICYYCEIGCRDIRFPRLMGGPKKCECYERYIKTKKKFKYPTKEELEWPFTKKKLTCSDCAYFNAAENVCGRTMFGYKVPEDGDPCEHFYSIEEAEKEVLE